MNSQQVPDAAMTSAGTPTSTPTSTPPSWLKPALLREVVGGGGPVRELEVHAMGAGDNFASTIVRFKVVTHKGEVQHLIVKRLPPDGDAAPFAVRAAFETEGRVYSMMPRATALLRAAGRVEPVGPVMRHWQTSPEPMLVFEDIAVEGFRLVSRDNGLDVAHSRLVLRTLARWHASMSVIVAEQPDLFDGMHGLICEENMTFVRGAWVKGFSRFLRHVEKWPGVSPETVAKLQRLEGTALLRRALDAKTVLDPDEFRTCMHGDLWTGNMLFKLRPDCQPEDMRLVDYQMCAVGAPAADLLHFFPCVNAEVRRRRAELVAEYHAELADCLRKLNVTRIPTLAELQTSLLRRGIIEVLQMAGCTALILAPHSVGLTLDNVLDEHDGPGPHIRDLCLEREPFRVIARQYLASWEEEGLLDELLAQEQYQ